MSEGLRFGRFEVRRVLGRGGMGTVYEAIDPVIGRVVAIKEIHLDSVRNDRERQEMEERFKLEFRTAGTLSHPNVVTVYDVGEAAGGTFIAMEHVEGLSLADYLKAEPRPPVERVIELAAGIAAGLDYAHAHGIVHRDIKPANVLLTRDLRPKLSDFGLVKLMSTELTTTGTLLGTPAFMPPEQIMGQPVGPASDQFSFAVMLYGMLTGIQPFRADHPSAILYKIVNETPDPPLRANPALPAGVDAVLLRGLAKKPADRYASCSELVEDLRRAFYGIAGSLPLHGVSDGRASGGGSSGGAGGREGSAPRGISSASLAGGADGREGSAARGISSASLAGAAGGGSAAGFEPGLPLASRRPAGAPQVDHFDAGPTLITRATKVERRSRRLYAGIAAAAVLLAGAGGFLLSRRGTQPPAVAPAAVTPAAQPAVPPPAASPAPSPAPVPAPPAETPAKAAPAPAEKTVPPGILAIEGGDYPLQLEIGGRRQNLGGKREIRLPPGRYEAVLVAEAVFLRQTYPVELGSGQRQTISAPPAVPVKIAANPANCRVSIDGRFVDVIPINDRRLVVGNHRFEFHWPAPNRTKTISVVVAKSDQRIFASLED